jgi:hypothetical protein
MSHRAESSIPAKIPFRKKVVHHLRAACQCTVDNFNRGLILARRVSRIRAERSQANHRPITEIPLDLQRIMRARRVSLGHGVSLLHLLRRPKRTNQRDAAK